MVRNISLHVVLALVALTGIVASAEPQLDIRLTFIPDPKKPSKEVSVIRIGLVEGKVEKYHLIRSDSPAASDPHRFKLLQEGDSKQEIKLTIIKRKPQPDYPGLQSEILLTSSKLDQSKSYTLQMVQAAGDRPGIEVKGFAPIAKFDPIKIGSAPINAAFLDRNKAIEKKISVLGGQDGSSASLKLTYGMDSLETASASTDRFWRFQSILDADVSYKPTEHHNYINSINGEVDFVLAQYFETKGRELASPKPDATGTDRTVNSPGVRGLYETGLASRFESDELFDKINLTIGWTNWLSLNSPAISSFATTLCFIGKPEANVPPILVFSYDYVGPVKDDLPASSKGEDTGRNRLRGRFYWSIQLAHDADLRVVHHYNADLLIDVGGVYDFASGNALPDVRLSLDIGPVSEDDKAPKFTLSFVNGKTTPTFRNYNALLAGLKLPF